MKYLNIISAQPFNRDDVEKAVFAWGGTRQTELGIGEWVITGHGPPMYISFSDSVEEAYLIEEYIDVLKKHLGQHLNVIIIEAASGSNDQWLRFVKYIKETFNGEIDDGTLIDRLLKLPVFQSGPLNSGQL